MLVQLVGYLGNDAEVTEKEDGKSFMRFSMADTQRVNGQDTTVWVKCFSHSTKIAPFLKKGKLVFVSGELTTSLYEGALDIKLNVQHIKLCGKKDEQPEN